jgi:FKBP-type peptidyl-prolyl cis-trans isomerase 2
VVVLPTDQDARDDGEEVGISVVDVDLNLSDGGQDLNFEVEILTCARPPEEIISRHVHGKAGTSTDEHWRRAPTGGVRHERNERRGPFSLQLAPPADVDCRPCSNGAG